MTSDTKQNNPSSPTQIAGLALLIGLLSFHANLLSGRVQDDSFISFRYARNLLDGHGLVWNIGDRVEGYSNFLWTLLVALGLKFGIDPLSFSRGLALSSAAATLVTVFLLSRHLFARNNFIAPLLAPLFLAGNWSLAVNLMTGLETSFFTLLLALSVLLVVEKRFLLASLVCGLAALTRPEAVALFLLFGLYLSWNERQNKKALIQFWLPALAIILCHEIFRLAYYGSLLPNTYYAKSGVSLPPSLPTKWSYLSNFFTKGLGLYGFFAVPLLAFFLKLRLSKKRMIVAIALSFGLLNVLINGADFMIGFRFLVPYLPFFALAIIAGFSELRSLLRPDLSKYWVLPPLLLVALVSGLSIHNSSERLGPFEKYRRRISLDANHVLGLWLKENLPANSLVVALDEGEIGYLSGLPILDVSGLTDKIIARAQGDLFDRNLDPNYVFGKNPTAFVFVSRSHRQVNLKSANPYWPPGSSLALLQDPRMANYKLIQSYPSYESLFRTADNNYRPDGDGPEKEVTYFLELWVKKDILSGIRR